MPDFGEFIDRGREERNLEYKDAQPWPVLKAKVIKTALGMANLPDGGTIIIGMHQLPNNDFEPLGLTQETADTYKDDDVRAAVNAFAEPHIDLGVYRFLHLDRLFVAIAVNEFLEIPVIAAKQGDGIREGAIYTRSVRMPETREVRTESEMRAILELATTKALARYLGTLSKAGVGPERLASLVSLTDDELFARERGGL